VINEAGVCEMQQKCNGKHATHWSYFMPARDLGFPLTLCALFSEDRLIDSILSSPSRREMRRLRSPEARLSQINE